MPLSFVLTLTILSDCASVAPLVVIPVNSISPNPSATNPFIPKELFEFVKSHCPPEETPIPISHPIVNIETNCAYPLLDIETPIPASLYCVNAVSYTHLTLPTK